MLGRTANDLFWMSRYIERAENIARLLEVGYRIALLPREGHGQNEEWRSTLRSAGCDKGYLSKYGTYDTLNVVNFMLFDGDNPSSVYSCLATARRNARAQRTAMTREMWESLNSAWLSYEEVRAGVGAEWKINSSLSLTMAGGYIPWRQFDFHRTDVRYHYESGAPFGALMLHGAF